MKFGTVKGHRKNSSLLWISVEGHLYFRKYNRRGKKEFSCYQNILKQNPKNQANKCSAAVEVQPGQCIRNLKAHSCHPDHRKIFDDLQSRNAIIDVCAKMKKIVKGLLIKVPAQEIFTLEMSK